MENNKETKKKINMVLLFEIIVFIAVLITYNYLTKFTLTENKIIADLVSEFSLSLDIMIVIRTITSILTVIISVLISSLLMIIFFNKLEKKSLKQMNYEPLFISLFW